MSNRHILITGGAGFIGSHLTEAFLAKNHFVTVIDNLSTGQASNLDQCYQNPKFKFILSDASNRPLLNELIPQHDIIFHLASAVGVKLIVEQTFSSIQNIINSSNTILEIAAAHKKLTIITSTSEVYGRSDKISFNEEDDLSLGTPYKLRWAYACAKLLTEYTALALEKETSFPVIIVRLFNTIGARQIGNYGMVLPNFINQALAQQPLTVHGDGLQKRCFCSVDDVVGGLIKLSQTPFAIGQIINLGNDIEISILDLAKKVINITQSNSSIQFIPYKEVYGSSFEDTLQRTPDLRKARQLINWNPQHDITETITKMTAHYATVMNI